MYSDTVIGSCVVNGDTYEIRAARVGSVVECEISNELPIMLRGLHAYGDTLRVYKTQDDGVDYALESIDLEWG